MNINQLINRCPKPAPWAEGDNIPWNDPEFSERMLKEHLSQEHDVASRRFDLIDQHVGWIHRDILGGRPSRILDLGCGPGLYAQRLARLGHKVVGIDFSPASLRFARETAEREELDCSYHIGELRTVDFGTDFDLVMQIFGEINVFRPADAERILRKAGGALNEQGVLLMEVQDFNAVQRQGGLAAGWHSASSGLFSIEPYLFLNESFWDEATKTATVRMYIINSLTAEITPYAQTFQAYRDEDYAALFERCGFQQTQFLPMMGGDLGSARGDFFPVVARKSALAG